MKIKRLKVDEGFFDGLDVSFEPGLNVLIGGRGVGKTSVIELIRFGLGASSSTPSSDKEALGHALAVLKSGQVSIDIELSGSNATVTRSASDPEPRSTVSFEPPIVFSQKEIETVGLNAAGRLALIDSFLPKNDAQSKEISSLISKIRSHTVAIARLRKEIDEVSDKTIIFKILKAKEKTLVKQQEEYAGKNQEIKNLQTNLDKLHNELGHYTVDFDNLSHLEKKISERLALLNNLKEMPPLPDLKNQGSKDAVKLLKASFSKELEYIDELIKLNKTYKSSISTEAEIIKSKIIEIEGNAREHRSSIEKFQEGAGSISRELGETRNKIAQTENLIKINKEKASQLETHCAQTTELIEKINSLRRHLFNQRKAVVSKLNEKLSPTIKAEISHLSRLGGYEEALFNTLRGSGLKYNELVPDLVSRVSPHELLILVNEAKYKELSSILGIPVDRATRLLSYLRENDLGPILTASIEDDVSLMLLDGSKYKPIGDLSIGQRCTVALSIVLENDTRVLLVDQPEDHLDNEFIAETLIKALSQRADKAQSIVSSHNANIPVLGNATKVINLDSNGRRGFIKCEGIIDNVDIKNAIEKIMEGGKDAFDQRASFYNSI